MLGYLYAESVGETAGLSRNSTGKYEKAARRLGVRIGGDTAMPDTAMPSVMLDWKAGTQTIHMP